MESCLRWKKGIDDAVGGAIPVVLIANKVLYIFTIKNFLYVLRTSQIDCGQLDGEQFSKENGFAGYFETSAKTGVGIKEAIHFMVKKVIIHIYCIACWCCIPLFMYTYCDVIHILFSVMHLVACI